MSGTRHPIRFVIEAKEMVKMMIINNRNIFLGAYQERLSQTKPSMPSQSRMAAITNQVTEAYQQKIMPNKTDTFTPSKEGTDFLEAKKSAEAIINDFWSNIGVDMDAISETDETANPFDRNSRTPQWMIFSQSLYTSGFYDQMPMEQVKKTENLLGKITSGMDNLVPGDFAHQQNVLSSSSNLDTQNISVHYSGVISEAEAHLELESSTAALKYFSDKFVPEEQKKMFNHLIDAYYEHNSSIVNNYSSSVEKIQKFLLAGQNRQTVTQHDSFFDSLPSMIGKYGTVEENKNASNATGKNEGNNSDLDSMKLLLNQLRNIRGKEEATTLLQGIQESYLKYASKHSQNKNVLAFVQNGSASSLANIRQYWNALLTA